MKTFWVLTWAAIVQAFAVSASASILPTSPWAADVIQVGVETTSPSGGVQFVYPPAPSALHRIIVGPGLKFPFEPALDAIPPDLKPGSPQGAGLTEVRLSVWRIRNPTAVPEPAAWLLMVLGFGAVGATIRSRRPLAQDVQQG